MKRMRDVVKEILLARLRDQPTCNSYPKHIITLLERIPSRCIADWIEETQRKRNHFTWDQIWWELQESAATLKHLERANLLSNQRLLKYRLRQGFPIDYMFGNVQFMRIKVAVRRPILIPRPDTEAWLQRLLKRNMKDSRILEIGTGTGCIALALAKHIPTASIDAIDISKQAIKLARFNHRANGGRSTLNCNFYLQDIMEHPGGVYDLILSNPPYISKCHRVSRVSPNVRKWESAQALHIDQEGTGMHRLIIDMVATRHLDAKAIALELDGTLQQFVSVKNYAKERLAGSKISPLADDHRKYRAILIEME